MRSTSAWASRSWTWTGLASRRASLPGEIVPGAEFYDYADKYVDDGSQALVPAPLSRTACWRVNSLAMSEGRLPVPMRSASAGLS